MIQVGFIIVFTWCSVQVQRWKCYDPVETQFSWFCFGRCTIVHFHVEQIPPSISMWPSLINKPELENQKSKSFEGESQKKEKFWGRISNKKKRCKGDAQIYIKKKVQVSALTGAGPQQSGLAWQNRQWSLWVLWYNIFNKTIHRKMNEKRPAALKRSWPLYLTRNTKHEINLSEELLKKHCQRHYGPRRWLL